MPVTTDAKCGICEVNPPLGVGIGKLKSTCASCIGKLTADGTCPVCRGVGLAADPEHIATCNGKLPKQDKPKERATKAKPDKGATRSATSMGQQAAASKRIDQRKVKEEIGRALMDEHGPIMDWKFEEVKERLTKKTIQYMEDGKLHELRIKRIKSVNTRDGIIVLVDDLNNDEHTVLSVTIRSVL